jgi:hypothetical protein
MAQEVKDSILAGRDLALELVVGQRVERLAGLSDGLTPGG